MICGPRGLIFYLSTCLLSVVLACTLISYRRPQVLSSNLGKQERGCFAAATLTMIGGAYGIPLPKRKSRTTKVVKKVAKRTPDFSPIEPAPETSDGEAEMEGLRGGGEQGPPPWSGEELRRDNDDDSSSSSEDSIPPPRAGVASAPVYPSQSFLPDNILVRRPPRTTGNLIFRDDTSDEEDTGAERLLEVEEGHNSVEEVRVCEERSNELRRCFYGMSLCTADKFVRNVVSCHLRRHF